MWPPRVIGLVRKQGNERQQCSSNSQRNTAQVPDSQEIWHGMPALQHLWYYWRLSPWWAWAPLSGKWGKGEQLKWAQGGQTVPSRESQCVLQHVAIVAQGSGHPAFFLDFFSLLHTFSILAPPGFHLNWSSIASWKKLGKFQNWKTKAEGHNAIKRMGAASNQGFYSLKEIERGGR